MSLIHILTNQVSDSQHHFINDDNNCFDVLLLVCTTSPLFASLNNNDAGWDAQRNTTKGIQRSERYNANIREFTLQYAIMEPLQQVCSSDAASGSTPKHSTPELTQVIKGHFQCLKHAIMAPLQQLCSGDAASGGTLKHSTPEFIHVIKEHFQCKCQAVKDQLEAWFSVSQYQQVQSSASLKQVRSFLEKLPVVHSALENNARKSESLVPSVSPFSGSFNSPVAQRSFGIDLTDGNKKTRRMPCKPEVIDLTGDDFEDVKACKKQKR